MIHEVGQVCFALAPTVGYFPQWWLIRQTGSEGFSPNVCLLLLLANITRVFFWFGQRFDSTLLYQALVMIFVQLLLLEAIVSVKQKARSTQNIQNRQEDSVWDWSKFWKWCDFTPYIQSLTLFSGFLSAVTIIFKSNQTYSHLIGSAAVAMESVISLPQLCQNYIKKNTAGLSLMMVMGWVMGDSFKLLYFVSTGSPFQFIYGAIFQLCSDTFVLIQMTFIYPSSTHLGKKKIEASS
mmetsp:Transcript_23359/g.30500  ORF Transcript_23359/g.30500 Transcript_23359/m.30500 type:complete len:237 (+) Transcript_23359:109-819(+)